MNFELSFALLWLGMCTFFSVVMVAGEAMSMMVFLIPFWLAGFVVLAKGIKRAKADAATKKHGQQSYGLVVDFSDSGAAVNNHPVWNAHVLVSLGNGCSRVFVEEAGTHPKYDVGDFLLVKYYQNDINILDRASKYAIPEHVKECLLSAAPTHVTATISQQIQQNKPQDFIVTEDSIIVDGVAYPRPK